MPPSSTQLLSHRTTTRTRHSWLLSIKHARGARLTPTRNRWKISDNCLSLTPLTGSCPVRNTIGINLRNALAVVAYIGVRGQSTATFFDDEHHHFLLRWDRLESSSSCSDSRWCILAGRFSALSLVRRLLVLRPLPHPPFPLPF